MQKYYTQKFIRQLPGMIVGNGAPPRVRSLRNNRIVSYQTFTIDIADNSGAAGTYTLDFPTADYPAADTQVVVEFTGAHTEQQLMEALILAINTNTTIYQNIGYAEADPAVGTYGITFKARVRGATPLTGNVTYTPGGTVHTVTVGNTVNPSTNDRIKFGLFVGQEAGSLPNDAALPTAGAATMTVKGVTMITQFSERDRVGQAGSSAYEPYDVMDVITATLQNKGVIVRAVEADIVPGDTIYCSSAAATLGQATTTSTGNIAVANAEVVEGSYSAPELGGESSVVIRLKDS